MLLLADRGFWSHALWGACAAAGADLLWRVKSDIRLPVRQPLPDGSWLSVVNGTREAHRRNMRNANRRSRGSRLPQETGPLPGDVTVRVIEFLITVTCEDGTTRTERYRAVTTLLDWRRYPAADLAAAYARRWGIESAYREAKSYLAGGRILRSRTPGLARQEVWALLITYQAIRALMCHAAAGTDPGRLSFTTALHAARRTLASPAATLASRRERDPREPPPRPPAPHLRPRPRRPHPPLPRQERQTPATTTARPLHPHHHRHQAQPPGNIMTSSNTPPARQPRLLKLLALRLSRRFYSTLLLPESPAADQRIHRTRRVYGPPPSAIRPWTPGSGGRAVHRPWRNRPRTGTDQPTDGDRPGRRKRPRTGPVGAVTPTAAPPCRLESLPELKRYGPLLRQGALAVSAGAHILAA